MDHDEHLARALTLIEESGAAYSAADDALAAAQMAAWRAKVNYDEARGAAHDVLAGRGVPYKNACRIVTGSRDSAGSRGRRCCMDHDDETDARVERIVEMVRRIAPTEERIALLEAQLRAMLDADGRRAEDAERRRRRIAAGEQ